MRLQGYAKIITNKMEFVMNHTRKIIRRMPENEDTVTEYGWSEDDQRGPIEIRTRADYAMLLWYIEENGYTMPPEEFDLIEFEEDASMKDDDTQVSSFEWSWSQEGVTSDI